MSIILKYKIDSYIGVMDNGQHETIAEVFGLKTTDNNSTQRRKDAKIINSFQGYTSQT